MGSRPQTLYALADSPTGLAAWLLDHGDGGGRLAAGPVSGIKRTTSETWELELFANELRAAFRSLRTNGGQP
jgi:hypothetical protein